MGTGKISLLKKFAIFYSRKIFEVIFFYQIKINETFLAEIIFHKN